MAIASSRVRIGALLRMHWIQMNAPQRRVFSNVSIEQGSYDSTQIELMMNDECILVDTADNIIGHDSKKNCHLSSNALLHRAFSVLLFDSQNRLLMQQRARHKITFPNYWTNTCCSHPLFIERHCEMGSVGGASLEDKVKGVREAAISRLNVELGIPTDSFQDRSQFQFMTRILYKALCDDEQWIEHELDYILIVRQNVALNLNENEVQNVKYCSRSELQDMFEDPSVCISPWFNILTQSGLVHQWWDDLENIVCTTPCSESLDETIHDFYNAKHAT